MPLAALNVGCDDMLYVSAHAKVGNVVGTDESGNPIHQTETAWGDGADFPGKNSGWFFNYAVGCEELP